MYSSGTVRVKFRVVRAMVSDVIDLFGNDVRFSDEDEEGVTVTTMTNELAAEQFAKSFAPDVAVLEPEYLRERLKFSLEQSSNFYKRGKTDV